MNGSWFLMRIHSKYNTTHARKLNQTLLTYREVTTKVQSLEERLEEERRKQSR